MPCCASDGRDGSAVPKRSAECESLLEGLGFGSCRVFVDGAAARIAPGPDGIGRLSDPLVENAVHEAFRNRGFLYVSIDLGENGLGAPDEGGLVSGLPSDEF
jgi:PP-loop superfamily ATP-utilizing enzyme